MGTSRAPTEAEERFNSAFSSMRNMDKLLWYVSGGDRSNRGWAKSEIVESAGVVKSLLDQMVEILEKEDG